MIAPLLLALAVIAPAPGRVTLAALAKPAPTGSADDACARDGGARVGGARDGGANKAGVTLVGAGLGAEGAVTRPSTRAHVTVAYAANLQYAFEELAALYETQSGVHVDGISGASGKFAAQILAGAPFDVFLSADTEFPARLAAAGQAAEPPRVYAIGALVVCTSDPALDPAAWKALVSDARVAKIAIANPETAPYGREAVRALEHEHLLAAAQPKFATGESIAQAGTFLSSRAAALGFLARAMVVQGPLAKDLRCVPVAPDAYRPIEQAVVLLPRGVRENEAAARGFYAFLFTPAARDVFGRYGYALP